MRVSDIQDDESLIFVSDSQDVQAIKESLGKCAECDECSAYFVEAVNGEYTRVYGIVGIIPHQYKQLHTHLD